MRGEQFLVIAPSFSGSPWCEQFVSTGCAHGNGLGKDRETYGAHKSPVYRLFGLEASGTEIYGALHGQLDNLPHGQVHHEHVHQVLQQTFLALWSHVYTASDECCLLKEARVLQWREITSIDRNVLLVSARGNRFKNWLV